MGAPNVGAYSQIRIGGVLEIERSHLLKLGRTERIHRGIYRGERSPPITLG
jgi:hypothetical protein